MPYIADPDEATVADVGRRLLAVFLRPSEAETIRIPRSKLHEIAAPDLRKEDFYEAIRRLAEQTHSVAEATGTGRRADVVLTRTNEDVGGWEFLFYDDFPDDFGLGEVVSLLTDAHGLDVSTPLPDDLLVARKQREPIKHDPDVPRTCGKCGETKETSHFLRRSSDPADRDYHRFQSYCRECNAAYQKDNRPYDARVRMDRWGTGRTGRIRPGGRHPNNPTYRYQFTN
ncbi:hypothetical protein [Blastococcus sp. TF02A-30]|uniref:hypothetical protein n=1 Tax=Blastococcus sp. TF02A-30 TaxID=2250580 RepID=UPI000DEA86BE|nr:hypothetical protein [Blastococcus sp. TF02A-30]RBY85743.1 hypothetical protein DQ241_15805 [Blastococcus sp. TF02A-30]